MRKNIKPLGILSVFMLLVLFLSGCRAAAATVPASETEPVEAFTPAPLASVDNDWRGVTDFSRLLFRAVLDEGMANPIISPLSAYFALGMTAPGAGGETAEEFSVLLGRNAQALVPELAALAAHLTATRGRTALNLANSVWVNDAFTVQRDFNHMARRYFGAPARARDFSHRATVDEINTWVYEQTEGLIGEVLSEIQPDKAMFLINALYLLAHWPSPMGTETRAFYPDPNTPVEVPFLRRMSGQLPVRVTDRYIAALLPYDDGRTGFLLTMPTDGTCVRAFAQAQCLNETLDSLHPRETVTLRMPELDKDFDINLNDILQAMGLYTAFEKFAADFPYLVEENDPPIFISEVRQLARIAVDRYGTEAAAVTVVAPAPAAAPLPPDDPLYLTFDRPFVYAIFDLPTGIPLFMGAVDNPA